MICRRYGFLPILRCLCLHQLYNQRRWGWLSYLRSACSAYILMLIRLLLLLCCIFLLTFSPVLGIDHASAQDPTSTDTPSDTPTPTNAPIFTDPTLVPTGHYVCTGNQPIGWGTVTPDPYWLMQCGMCITPDSSDFFGDNPFDITSTPDPNITPTVTPTITATPQNDLLDAALRVGGMPVPIEIPTNEFRTTTSDLLTYGQIGGINITDTAPQYTPITGSIKLEIAYNLVDHVGTTYGEGIKLIVFPPNSSGLVLNCISGSCSSFIDTDSQAKQVWIVNTISGGSGTETLIFEFSYAPKYGHSIGFMFQIDAGKGSTFSGTYTYTGQGSEFFTIDPTPTPVYSDCSTVDPADGSSGDDDGFSLPDIGLGWGRCLTLGGWNIGLEWAQAFIPTLPDGWEVPGIEICFVPIEFGSLNLFGLGVDLDLIAAVMAGVLIIRIIRQ